MLYVCIVAILICLGFTGTTKKIKYKMISKSFGQIADLTFRISTTKHFILNNHLVENTTETHYSWITSSHIFCFHQQASLYNLLLLLHRPLTRVTQHLSRCSYTSIECSLMADPQWVDDRQRETSGPGTVTCGMHSSQIAPQWCMRYTLTIVIIDHLLAICN